LGKRRGGRRKRRKAVGGEMKKGQIGVDDAWRDSHLVNSIKLVDRWEGPFLTLSSQKRPTLPRMRRGERGNR
jgi:hypothetical protein